MSRRDYTDETRPANVAEAKSRFDEISDFTLATRLQNEEYGEHYAANRHERRLVGSDVKLTREETQRQEEMRRAQQRTIVESDEDFARRLQAELILEEERSRQLVLDQAANDEAIARQLQEREAVERGGVPPAYSETEQNVMNAMRVNPHSSTAFSSTPSSSSSTAPSALIDVTEDVTDLSLPTPPPFVVQQGAATSSTVPSTVPVNPFETDAGRWQVNNATNHVHYQPHIPPVAGSATTRVALPGLARPPPHATPTADTLQPTMHHTATVLPPTVSQQSLQYQTTIQQQTRNVSPPLPTLQTQYQQSQGDHAAPPPYTPVDSTHTTIQQTLRNPLPVRPPLNPSGNTREATGNIGFYSEFGLPPPSALAQSRIPSGQWESTVASTSRSTVANSSNPSLYDANGSLL